MSQNRHFAIFQIKNAIDIVKLRAMETTFLDTVIYKGDRFNCHRSG